MRITDRSPPAATARQPNIRFSARFTERGKRAMVIAVNEWAARPRDERRGELEEPLTAWYFSQKILPCIR